MPCRTIHSLAYTVRYRPNDAAGKATARGGEVTARPASRSSRSPLCRAVASDWSEEVECYRQALRLRPNYPEAHNNLAILYAEALRLWPQYPEGHYNYGI